MSLPCFANVRCDNQKLFVPMNFVYKSFKGLCSRCFDDVIREAMDKISTENEANFPKSIQQIIKKDYKGKNLIVEGEIKQHAVHQIKLNEFIFSVPEFREICEYFHEPVFYDEDMVTVQAIKPKSSAVKFFCATLLSDEFTLGNKRLVFSNPSLRSAREFIVLYDFGLRTIVKNKHGDIIVWHWEHSFIGDENILSHNNKWALVDRNGNSRLFDTSRLALEALLKLE